MTEEFCSSMDSSSDNSDILLWDRREKQNISHKKAKVFIDDTTEYGNDIERPAYFPTLVCSGKPDKEARISRKVNHHPQRMLGFVHNCQDPSKAQSTSNRSTDEVLAFVPVFQRKTHQQFGQGKKAGTIQSVWRDSQARQNMEKLNEAATQIQATFRGYLTRKELPLGLCSYGWTEGQKKTRTRNQTCSSLTFPSCRPQSGLDSGRPAESQCTCLPSHKPRHYPKKMMDNYSPLNQRGPYVITSPLRSSKTGFPSTSFNVFASNIEKQRYQVAAATIQAAWRAYQIRQKRKPFIQVNRSPFLSHTPIKQGILKNTKLGCTFEELEMQQILGNSDILLLRKAPRIRNINIHTVVKNLSVSSPKPNISIEVKSPHAVIQGFQRDLNSGAQAVYSMRNANASGASQILIHVNMQKGNNGH